MEQYINKSALVAELNNRINLFKDIKNETTITLTNAWVGILSFINNLEVKEVDLEKELKHYCNDYYNCDYPKQLEEETCSEVMPHIVSAAKHFFELGLKVQKGE